MTDRLYYHNAFLKEFEARVISCNPDGARWKVVLDRTAFYPTSGGQPHDLGTLGAAAVVEVADAEDHSVVHYTDASLPPGPVRGIVDWNRRFDHMQQHTGQHLLSAVFIELFGFQTVSFHLGRESSTIDLQAQAIVPRHLDEAERRVNELIFDDRTVTVRFGTAEELAAAGIRKEVRREGVLRAVEIEGIDRQPCGGTHLASTGQAGLLLLRGIEHRRDSWRIEFVCGFRALAAARGDFASLGKAATLLSCGRPEVPASVEKLIEERRTQHSSAKRLEEALAGYQARALRAGATAGVVAEVLPDATAAYLKLLAARVVEQGSPAPREGGAQGTVIVLVASASSGAVVAARSPEAEHDMAALLRQALGELGGEGGGSPAFAQGALTSASDAGRLIERLKALISAGGMLPGPV